MLVLIFLNSCNDLQPTLNPTIGRDKEINVATHNQSFVTAPGCTYEDAVNPFPATKKQQLLMDKAWKSNSFFFYYSCPDLLVMLLGVFWGFYSKATFPSSVEWLSVQWNVLGTKTCWSFNLILDLICDPIKSSPGSNEEERHISETTGEIAGTKWILSTCLHRRRHSRDTPGLFF